MNMMENEKGAGVAVISSGIDADSFGKIRMAGLMESKGLVVTVDGGKAVSCSGWGFTGTAVIDGTVWFCGDVPFVFRALDEILGGGCGGWDKKKAALAAVAALSASFSGEAGGFPVGNTGGCGILVSDDCTRVLLLPGDVCEFCAVNSGAYAKKQGFFIYKGLGAAEQSLFTRAVIAYRALSGTFPYAADDDSVRQTDILDRNFVPLSHKVNGIAGALSSAVDAGLSIPLSFEPIPGERRYRNDRAEKIRAEIIARASAFDLDSFSAELFASERKPELSDEEFRAREENESRSRRRRISFSRFFRRNRARIFGTAVAAVVAAFAAGSFVESNGRLATSRGLSSAETAHVFYSFAHKADVPNLSEIAKGRKMKDFIQIITGFYVNGKERESFNASDKTVSPEEWVFFKPSTTFWMYGITNLRIDGNPVPSRADFPRRSERREPVREENGKMLKKGDVSAHAAEYFFITMDASRINVERVSETVSLEWNGSRWIVRALEPSGGKNASSSVRIKEFASEYQAALDSAHGDVRAAAASLREKYPWLPSETDMESGARDLVESYGSTAAESFLSGAR